MVIHAASQQPNRTPWPHAYSTHTSHTHRWTFSTENRASAVGRNRPAPRLCRRSEGTSRGRPAAPTLSLGSARACMREQRQRLSTTPVGSRRATRSARGMPILLVRSRRRRSSNSRIGGPRCCARTRYPPPAPPVGSSGTILHFLIACIRYSVSPCAAYVEVSSRVAFALACLA